MSFQLHRLLDEAFADVPMTADLQDLKEELRANLLERAAELEQAGIPAGQAAERAVAELGDIHELIRDAGLGSGADTGSVGGLGTSPPPSGGRDTPASSAVRADMTPPRIATLSVERIRPKPAFVLRTIAWAVLLAGGLTVAILGAVQVLPLPIGPVLALLGLAATGLGLLVGDALSQETTTNHPMPEKRAAGYALACWLALAGVGFGGLIALGALPLWCLVFAAIGVVAAIGGFVLLGVSQTNRHKAWARRVGSSMPPNRFAIEPETAARFGIYAGALWMTTIAVIAVVGFTAGWIWVPLPFFLGLAVMMVMLARMMFGQRKSD